MATGRTLTQATLRPLMSHQGWAPRAAGWFTRAVAPDSLGVVAVGIATKHVAPGTAMATLYVHLRDDQLEMRVADLVGRADDGYKTVTSSTSIGYVMPDARWREWYVEPLTADAVAQEMADAVHHYAEPYLEGLASNTEALLASVMSSPSYTLGIGLARAVLLLRRSGRLAEATELLEQRLTGLETRTDAAAADERRVAGLLTQRATA